MERSIDPDRNDISVKRSAKFREYPESLVWIDLYRRVAWLIRPGNLDRSISVEDLNLSWHPCQSSWSISHSLIIISVEDEVVKWY